MNERCAGRQSAADHRLGLTKRVTGTRAAGMEYRIHGAKLYERPLSLDLCLLTAWLRHFLFAFVVPSHSLTPPPPPPLSRLFSSALASQPNHLKSLASQTTLFRLFLHVYPSPQTYSLVRLIRDHAHPNPHLHPHPTTHHPDFSTPSIHHPQSKPR